MWVVVRTFRLGDFQIVFFEWGENDHSVFVVGLFDRPSRLMFFINPISGNGKSLRIFEKYLAPIMNLCDVSYAHEVTIHENHAREWILQQMPDESGKSFDGCENSVKSSC